MAMFNEAAQERLRSILAVWSRLIWLVQAARLIAVSIAGLAVVERLMASHGLGRIPPGTSTAAEQTSAPPTILQ